MDSEDAFAALLDKDCASFEEIQGACFHSIPDKLRPTFWKLLLNYLPINRDARQSALERGRSQYRMFLEEVTTKPGTADVVKEDVPSTVEAAQVSEGTHLLRSKLLAHQCISKRDEDSSLSKYKRLLSADDTACVPGHRDSSPLFASNNSSLFGSEPRVAVKSQGLFTGCAEATLPAQAPQPNCAQKPSKRIPEGHDAAASTLPKQLVADDPLSVLVGSRGKWAEWHRDEELRCEIEKDIQRTLPGLHFFTVAEHLAAMSRILFVYAKLNAGVRYVQGMNELLAPLWYVLAHENGPDTDMAAAEADTFFCFMGLMSEVRDVFIKAHDNSPTGVRGMLTKYAHILRNREPSVAAHFASMHLDHQFYAFRWITTLLSREFPMPDVVMLWDCMFADSERFLFLLQLGVGMIRLQRSVLLSSDFGGCMKLLQNYPPIDITRLLTVAIQVRDEEAGIIPSPPNGSASTGSPESTSTLRSSTGLLGAASSNFMQSFSHLGNVLRPPSLRSSPDMRPEASQDSMLQAMDPLGASTLLGHTG